jgi:hypothetical protein
MTRLSLKEIFWLESDEKSCFIEDFSIDSEVILITFGGGWFKPGGARFALINSTSDFPVKKLYVRDPRFAWYHQGLPEIGGSIHDIALFLQKKIKEQDAQKVVMTGGSMGGYAALLFGWLVEADQVHAFNPVTVISPVKRFLNGDFFRLEWKPLKFRLLMRSVYKSPKFSKRFSDLKGLFGIRDVKTQFHIHFSYQSRMDRRHATRMGVFPNVILHGYNEKIHSLKMLKKNGRLEKILLDSLKIQSD